MAESADATDLKSVGGNTVRVRPPLAPQTAANRPVLFPNGKYGLQLSRTQPTFLEVACYLPLLSEAFLTPPSRTFEVLLHRSFGRIGGH